MKNDDPIIEAFKNLADQRYRWGFWMMHHYLRNEGAIWNHMPQAQHKATLPTQKTVTVKFKRA